MLLNGLGGATVRVDGQLLELAAESRTRTFGGADEMKVAFQPHAAGLGTTVTIDTPSLELVVYLVSFSFFCF